MSVTGKYKVFTKKIQTASGEFTAYSIGLGNKEQDGTWTNAYLSAKFRKGVEVPNNTTIEVKDGFLTAQKGKDYNRPMLMILDFEVLPAGQKLGSGFMAVDDSDIPF